MEGVQEQDIWDFISNPVSSALRGRSSPLNLIAKASAFVPEMHNVTDLTTKNICAILRVFLSKVCSARTGATITHKI